MAKCLPVSTFDVCLRASRVLALALGGLAFAVPAAAQVTAHGGTLKVGFYNIQSGKGEPGLPGHPTPFADTSNCTDSSLPLNAWGIGFVQQELTAAIGSDPAVIALGLAEAWSSVCASPDRVRQALGWKARSDSNNGLGIVARHGFSGAVTFQKLDTSESTDLEPRYVAHAKVCIDAACAATLDVFVTHMMATGSLRNTSMTTQVKQLLSFMAAQAGTRPRVILGDFNLYEEYEPTCGSSSWPSSILDNLRNAGYKDAWRTLRGTTLGYTGMTNRRGCGSPEGSTYKRIDYSWSLDLAPMSVKLFAAPPPGDPAPSDHYGILAEYSFDGSVPPPDTTGPDVAVTAPASGATVGGPVTFSASATDLSGVARVEFFVDGAPAGSDSSAPYTATWNTTVYANGPHTLQARAVDSLGNGSVSALRTVTVENAAGPGPAGPGDEVVLYASFAAISGTRWRVADDATAASGRLLFNANLGAAKPAGALAAPVDYADLTFRAEKGRAYRLWIRGKAAGNGWANDSVYVQFSDTVDETGAARWRIGTTSSTTVQVEEGLDAEISGWGWADNGYDGAGPLVYFEETGDHTLRLQIREDGISIDQVVLSAVKYLTAMPGVPRDDTTILPIPQPGPGDPPPGEDGTVTVYDAITDRVARPKPTLPLIGGAGFQFVDPVFGSRLLRVTDAQTRPSAVGRSFKTPSAAHQTAWNVASTYFYVLNSGGNIVPFAFDAATMTASRINPAGSEDGGLMLSFHGEPQFSYVDENLIFGVSRAALRTIQQYDFATDTYTPLLDLQTLGVDLSGTYVGGVMSSGGPVEKILAWYGGTGQDRHFRVIVFERQNPSRRRVLDTLASTIDGKPASTLLNFKLHHVEIDRSGRYVMLSPTGPDRQAPRNAEVEYIWDMQTDSITALDDVENIAGGHKALGYGRMLNKGCCTTSTWDAAQWQIRSLATPTLTTDLIDPVLLPKQINMSDHVSWNNAQADRLVPFVTALYRYGNNTVEWRAWDDEIVAVKTEAGTGTTVWRFAHHRSNVASDTDPAASNFWYMPRLNVSQNGRWAIFTSNWEKTLGQDAGVTSRVEYRQDVFLVELTGSSTAPPPPDPNDAPTVSITAPAPDTVMIAGTSLAIAAAAADADGTVVRVEFFADGQSIGADTTAPFTAAWSVPAAGSYSLSAVAVDNDGASTTSGAVVVSAVASLTIVTSSLPGGRVGDPYAAVLTATGGVGTYTWTTTGGSLPAGMSLDASGALSGTPESAGSFTFTATATDGVGRSGSRALTIPVQAPNQAPVVTISAPAAGDVVAVGAAFTVTATATDADGAVQRVDLYANGTLIGSRTSPPWTAQWTPTYAASVNLRAVAIDNEGASGSSAIVAITVLSEVVIYAGDASAVVGNYRFVSDATAAGGRRLLNPNRRAPKVRWPLMAPTSYIEFTFHAQAGRPYHLWIRGKAEADGWANDAAFVQFSGAVDAAGLPAYRIGTMTAAVYEVEEGVDALLSGWGWQDTAYGGSAPPIYFAATGPQRIRLQPREDGLSIDQIVISPVTWLEARPGATKNDATIVKK